MSNFPCPACSKPVPAGARFCPACGASTMPTQPSATVVPAPPVPPKRSGNGCLILIVAIFVIGVVGRCGWDWWQARQKAAAAEAFYALARPLLGTWKVVEDPNPPRYTYTTRFLPNESGFLPGEAPETLFIDCVENPRAAQWTLSSAVAGRLIGGGVDQTPAGSDFYTAHGSGETSPDGRRLTLRMTWDGTREVVTVLERQSTTPDPAHR